jgi:hypothetical protein
MSDWGRWAVRRNVFSKGAAVVTAGLLAAGLLAASAAAATFATSGRASAGQPARRSAAGAQARAGGAASAPTPAQRWLLADRRALTAQRAGGVITGIAQAGEAAPLEGICVTATGPSGRRLGVTLQDGRFLIAGLRPGWYSLQYRDCRHPGGSMQPWYGGTMTRPVSRRVLVSSSGLVPVAPVTLQRLTFAAGRPALAGAPAGQAMSLLDQVRAAVSAGQPAAQQAAPAPAGRGRISGRVTDQRGHPLAGICVETFRVNGGGFANLVTGRSGTYLTGKLPAGRYIAFFSPGCGNSGNWLPQVYKDSDNLSKPTIFAVRAGQTTGHIDAALRAGGEISGTVTNAAGQKLSGICVAALPVTPRGPVLFNPTVSRRGIFHVHSLAAGRYRVLFLPCQPSSPYAPVWWKNSATQQRARVIRVADGQQVSGINQVMPIGGKITGVVRAGSPSGPTLAGICVDAVPISGEISFGTTATRADGSYVLQGLATGRYHVQFYPGCNNNGSYLPENYPRPVAVTEGRTHAGINGVLPLGARVSGVVTDSRGHPIRGICVLVLGSNGPYFNQTQTAANGSYAAGQLRAGSYMVQFTGGCGNPGSYAPQGYHGTNVNAPQQIAVGAGQRLSGINAVMQPGATIAGRVTSSSGTGLSGVCVTATTPGLAEGGGLANLVVSVAVGGPGGVPGVGFASTVRGRYQIRNLTPGQYQVAFAGGCGSGGDLAAQWYSARRGAGPPAFVFAGGGHPTSGVDVVMQAGGAISGTIRSASGRSLPGACVMVTSLNGNVRLPVSETFAFGSGYQLSGLVPGAYHVAFIPACLGLNYATQWYSGKPSPAGAARVIVRAGHTTAGIDSALTAGGSITGLVTSAATHAALTGICAAAQNVAQQDDFGFGVSGRQGRYVISGLNSGRYEIEFFPCGGGSLAGQVRPALVTVAAPRQTRGIGAAMGAGGSIEGHVTSGSPAAPGQALCVDAFGAGGGFASAAVTDAAGLYRIPNLPAGRYLVYVGDPACPFGPYNVVPQWYAGQASRAGATAVTVTGGRVTSGVDANLALDGSVTGSVTGPGGAPLTGVCVSAISPARGAAPVIAVTAGGGYTLGDLTPGRYRVEFSSGCGAVGYATQWWKNAGSAAAATIITVTADATVTGISAALRK